MILALFGKQLLAVSCLLFELAVSCLDQLFMLAVFISCLSKKYLVKLAVFEKYILV